MKIVGPYVAHEGKVWKKPTYRLTPAGMSISAGFPIAVMTEWAGSDNAHIVADLMNLGHRAQRDCQ